MSQAERYAWLSLAAWTLILFFLLMRFTAGIEVWGQSLGFTIVQQSAGELLGTYVLLVIFAIVAESAIAGTLAAVAGKTDIEVDERDRAIDARASLAAYWFTAAALNVIVIQVLAGAAFGGGHVLPQLPLTSFTTLTGVSFALLLTLTLAEIVKRIAVIWNHRRS
jgi:hypothetical protein